MKQRILVTGANGQLGRTIEELYSKNSLGLEFTFVSKSELDITKKQELESFFRKNKFNYCINCAAYTNVEQAEKTPEIAYKINAEGVKNLAEVCLEFEVILIHISTDYVFDGEKKEPYTVHDPTNAINEYGKSKLLGEQYIQKILKQYYIVRTSWLYSKKYGNNFYRNILNKAKTNKQLSIATDQLGCPTDTINLSNYIINKLLCESSTYGIHHFCDENEMTWYDFSKLILKDNDLIDKIILVKADKYFTFANRPKYSVLKNNK